MSCNLSNLTFGYSRHRAVITDISAQLQPGRVCALIGPNASGKTTLLRLMLGQRTPWSGSVQLDGHDVVAMSARQRAAMISYVPQRTDVQFAFTVQQVVEMGRFALEPDVIAVREALEMCDLETIADRYFSELSVGQQQRVLLARAIAQSVSRSGATAGVMLLDEPGSAMDLWHVHQMMQTLAGLAAQGLAILVVLHDLNLAARYADDVWLLDEGKLVAAGAWAQVMQRQVLEPVYRVGLEPMLKNTADPKGRPVFFVDPSATL